MKNINTMKRVMDCIKMDQIEILVPAGVAQLVGHHPAN